MFKIATHNSSRHIHRAVYMLWLAPFLLASSLVASARHRHDWESTPIQIALAYVFFVVGCSATAFHKSTSTTRRDRLEQTAFLVFISLAAFVVIIRLLFPIPSTPLNDRTRINLVLDELLLWPFFVFSLTAACFATSSPTWRHSLYVSFSAILMFMLALSMNSISKHWLRSFNGLFN